MRFMVTSSPKPDTLDALKQALPSEIAHATKLQEAGVVTGLYASGPGRAWAVVDAGNLEEAEQVVAGLPIRPYVDTTIDALMN